MYPEYDSMHPQLPFRNDLQKSVSVSETAGSRSKRAMPQPMTPIKFMAPDLERDGDYWSNVAQDKLRIQLQKNMLNRNIARNIILFLGDGMSIPTQTATRVYMGGEDRELSFEKFPYSGLSKVGEFNI